MSDADKFDLAAMFPPGRYTVVYDHLTSEQVKNLIMGLNHPDAEIGEIKAPISVGKGNSVVRRINDGTQMEAIVNAYIWTRDETLLGCLLAYARNMKSECIGIDIPQPPTFIAAIIDQWEIIKQHNPDATPDVLLCTNLDHYFGLA